MSRKYNLRRIKATWPYTVQEIASLLGIHKNAVLRWCKEGLQVDQECRPWLIRGDSLIRFLSDRQTTRKHKCGLTEFYCFRCREPRKAYLNIVDIVIENATRIRVKTVCEKCDAAMGKVQSVQKMDEIRKHFHVQQQHDRRIRERGDTSVNSDKE